ncbi:uncharacterized protein LOC122942299 [Bufo gargarizans]|uniref:uncharacterized protein LOC122942299 n=1 Tax=Bufo gargarizans TaxID=30331 RepID=UPI001CF1A09D|nr:uncharacterized protein LOC122942299 [Bufo gargarizans]
MRATSLIEMWLITFLSLVCCSLAFDICIGANKHNNILLQVPYQIEANVGENAVINCTVHHPGTNGTNMRKRFEKIFFIGPKGISVHSNYRDRLSSSGNKSHFSVTLKNLTVKDSDIYLCDTLVKFSEICAHGTLLIVRPPVGNIIHEDKSTTKEAETCTKNTFAPAPYIVTISAMLVLFVAVFIYMKLKESKEKQNFNQNTYVDMTQTLRRNTMGNSFINNRTENEAVHM